MLMLPVFLAPMLDFDSPLSTFAGSCNTTADSSFARAFVLHSAKPDPLRFLEASQNLVPLDRIIERPGSCGESP